MKLFLCCRGYGAVFLNKIKMMLNVRISYVEIIGTGYQPAKQLKQEPRNGLMMSDEYIISESVHQLAISSPNSASQRDHSSNTCTSVKSKIIVTWCVSSNEGSFE